GWAGSSWECLRREKEPVVRRSDQGRTADGARGRATPPRELAFARGRRPGWSGETATAAGLVDERRRQTSLRNYPRRPELPLTADERPGPPDNARRTVRRARSRLPGGGPAAGKAVARSRLESLTGREEREAVLVQPSGASRVQPRATPTL